MKTPRLLLLCIFLLVSLMQSQVMSASVRPERLQKAIDDLDGAVEKREFYRGLRLAYVDSLRRCFDATKSFDVCRKLSNALVEIDVDSAYLFVQKAYRLAVDDNDARAQNLVALDYAWMLHRRMLFADAIQVLESVDVEGFRRADSISYYSILGQTCLRALQQQAFNVTQTNYRTKALESLDSLSVFFAEGTLARRITDAQIYYVNNDTTLGVGELNEVFERITPEFEAYSIVANMLASFYKNKPTSRDEYLFYLALSAASDVRTANGEPQSLVALASELFSDGDVDRAYSYLNAAAEVLKHSGSTMLSADIIKPLTEVNRHILKREADSRNIYLLIVGLCALATIGLAVLYVRKCRRVAMSDKQIQLLADNVANRELYINQLLEICSVHLESMEDFNRLVGRKLKAGQSKDLYNDVESGRWLSESHERFFEAFDAAVLKIFPGFVDQLNALLLPDKPLAQPAADRLSPEMRIIAFMRLGVVDSTRISKFLGLSLTTVYTYRNRVKSRALDRDNFEENILKIGQIS